MSGAIPGAWDDAAMTLPEPALTLEAIQRARTGISPVFRDSPQYVHEGLSARAGIPVIVKIETMNPIRSFKGRGSWLAVHALAGEGRVGPERPVVVASAGNFGQGIAYAARSLGVPVVVFASRQANPGKVARMRALGATVIAAGEDFDEACAASQAYATEHRAELLVDGEDVRIATGAGTMALEVTDAVDVGVLAAPAVALVPVGNGSLIIGVGSVLHAVAPGCRVIGVQPEGAPAMTLSWRAARPIDTASVSTYADGAAARVAIPAAVALMASTVDDMVLVSEDALHAAQAILTEELGVTVEGAAALAWAGLAAIPRPDGPALLIITGSND
jgi:threonine dehydratase